MFKTNKTLIAQIVLITFLGFALIAPIAPANADTPIALQGEIEAATIDIELDTTTLNLDIATGDTEASDAITVTSTSQIPVKMTLVSVAHKAESWKPTLTIEDPTTLGLTDAQSHARFSLISATDNPNYAVDAPAVVPPATITPTGDGTTVDGTTYPVNLGTIVDSDGTAEKSVVITGKLEVSKKRIVSKAFDAEMVLNFAADIDE